MSWCFLTLCSTLLLTALTSDETAKEEYARFEGVWSFAHVEVEGKTQPEAPFPGHKIIITKDGHFVVVQGPRITRGVFKVDPLKTPKQFDQTIIDGPAKGRTSSSIYELNGDSYKICSSLSGTQRPDTMETKPGGGLILHVLKRERQPVREALIEVCRKELEGTWQAVSYTLDGKTTPAEDIKNVTLTIDSSGKVTARREGKSFIGGTTTIDPTQDPITIDIAYTEGEIKGKTALGIYKIEGELLTICRTVPGHPRPTEFVSSPGSGHTLMTYTRENAKK